MKKLFILLITLFLVSLTIQLILATTPGPICEEISNLTIDLLRETQGGVGCYDDKYNPVLDMNKDELISFADILLLASNVRNWELEQSEAWCQEKLEDTTNPCTISSPQIVSQDAPEQETTSTPKKDEQEGYIYSGNFECINEGELLDITLNKNSYKVCCSGLTEFNPCFQYISIGDKCYTSSRLNAKCPTKGCIKCGDGICSSKENVCNCPKDCIEKKQPNYATIKDFCIAMNYPSQNLCEAWDLCSLCNENNICNIVGLRINNSYCSLNNTLETQKEIDLECKENYECKSDACFMERCIYKNLIQVVITFFKELFN